MTTEDAVKKRDELYEKYNALQQQKQDIDAELLKLQGEYRLLTELFPGAAFPSEGSGVLTDQMELSPEEQVELDEAKARVAANIQKRKEAAGGE